MRAHTHTHLPFSQCIMPRSDAFWELEAPNHLSLRPVVPKVHLILSRQCASQMQCCPEWEWGRQLKGWALQNSAWDSGHPPPTLCRCVETKPFIQMGWEREFYSGQMPFNTHTGGAEVTHTNATCTSQFCTV